MSVLTDFADSRPRVLFVGGPDYSSKAIERAGFGPWCHAANILADGTVLDARDDVVQDIVSGVQIRPKGYLETEPQWALFEAPSTRNYSLWTAAGRSQLGKPYDERGIADFALNVFTGDYVDPNYKGEHSLAWFCDCLALWMAITSGDLTVPPAWCKLFTKTPTAACDFFIGAAWRCVASHGV